LAVLTTERGANGGLCPWRGYDPSFLRRTVISENMSPATLEAPYSPTTTSLKAVEER